MIGASVVVAVSAPTGLAIQAADERELRFSRSPAMTDTAYSRICTASCCPEEAAPRAGC